MKEAYTKSLGLGLGFDFNRIHFNPLLDTVSIDGKEPEGWVFKRFQLLLPGDGLYVGVAAELVGGNACNVVGVEAHDGSDWRIEVNDASSFTEQAVRTLQ